MGTVKSTLRGYLENPDNFGENNGDRIREAEILSNNPLHRGTKRRREVEENISACNEEIERLLNTPKKKKLHTTSQYIYDNLFQAGKDSDVVLRALGKSWKLHKLYLQQSPYFASLFSGRWVDGNKTVYNINVVDPCITLDSLHITFGSLYQDEITVEPGDVIPVLAAASLFQLEGVINQCLVIMDETVNVETVVRYWEACQQYGCAQMSKVCVDWLTVNLLSNMPDHPARLREISPALMSDLVSSAHLFVMQTEFSVYVLLRLWMFLQLHPAWDGEPQDAVSASQRYFKDSHNTNTYFLDTTEADPFLAVFRNIRLPHLINHHMDVEMLVSDKIVPDSWMSSTYYARWMTLLRLDCGIDRGPQDLNEETFDRECLRCGRTLNTDGQHIWRWTGFNSGLDLIITYDNYRLTMKRNIAADHEALTSSHKKRHVAYRVTVVSCNDQKQTIYKETSGIKQASLGKNESCLMLEMDPVMTVFPLLLSFNFCVSTPLMGATTAELEEEDQQFVNLED